MRQKQMQTIQTQQTQIGQAITHVDQILRRDFPRYAEFTNLEPLKVDEVRRLLRSDEAVLVQITTAEATFLWLLQLRDATIFVRINLGRQRLADLVNQIRQSVSAKASTAASNLPTFDVRSAYTLYQFLFAPLQKQLTGITHLIFVPDAALHHLSPAILLQQPASPPGALEDYPRLAWLGRAFAISMLPSVQSLRSLREFTQPSTASHPFLGIGDPDLSHSTEKGHLDLSSLPPLPGTMGELHDIARALNSDSNHLLFRERATEAMVKQYASLSSFRVVAFGIHCLLPNDSSRLAEPALVLTPPAHIHPPDDGLLHASEIAQLKLNTEWVILPACHTDSSHLSSAQGLTSLEIAFFYAGARALLMSHWAIASEVVGLVAINTLEHLAADPRLGRAESLRKAILPLMDGQYNAYLAHPHFWAPFTVVGEGRVGRTVME